MAKYSLEARVYDATFPDWECVTYLGVTVNDVNDNAPDFLQSNHKVSLSEDSPVGTFVTKMNAVDFDRGKQNHYLFSSNTY